MVTVPAIVWAGGPTSRGVMVGGLAGLFFGTLAWLDSGMVAAGAVVFVVLGIGSGVWMARRMTRHWPGSRALSGAQRRCVVAGVRRGDAVEDAALAPAALGYARALHGAAEKSWRPLVVFVLIVALGTAVWDTTHGSVGNLIASLVYLVLVGLELFWWPRRRAHLLRNADRATALVN